MVISTCRKRGKDRRAQAVGSHGRACLFSLKSRPRRGTSDSRPFLRRRRPSDADQEGSAATRFCDISAKRGSDTCAIINIHADELVSATDPCGCGSSTESLFGSNGDAGGARLPWRTQRSRDQARIADLVTRPFTSSPAEFGRSIAACPDPGQGYRFAGATAE